MTISSLPASITRLLDAGGIGDHDDRLRTRPAALVWSPLEYLAHTGDAIDWYRGRVRRVLSEDRPILAGFDWDAHTAGQNYHQRHLTDVLGDVRRVCTSFAALLATLDPADWQRAGTGSDGGSRTIAHLVHRAAHEARHHRHDITSALNTPLMGDPFHD
ncbi:MAG TPA: DinB family protein [Pseudonocardiaceae bacterium]|nr:DinB family protein [Pseudonocardiaceae bacterium]